MPVEVQGPSLKSSESPRACQMQERPAPIKGDSQYEGHPSAHCHQLPHVHPGLAPGAHLVAQASSTAFGSSQVWQESWVCPMLAGSHARQAGAERSGMCRSLSGRCSRILIVPTFRMSPLPICLYTLSAVYHFDMDSLLATTAQLACKIHRVPTFCHCSC